MLPFGTAAIQLPASFIYFTPCWVTTATTVDAFVLEVVTAAGAGTSSLVFAVYAPTAAGKPGARILNFATPISFAGTGLHVFSTGGSVVLPPALYFIASLWTGTAAPAPFLRMTVGVHPAISGTSGFNGSTATGYRQAAVSMPVNAAPALVTPVNVPMVLYQIG
jgi:hypothetical protein